MDTSALSSSIQRFFSELKSVDFLKEHNIEHKRRSENAIKLFQVEHLENATKEEFQAFFKDTDAYYGVRSGANRLWVNMFGQADENLPKFRNSLKKLIECAEAGINAQEITEHIKALRGIGIAFLSEILALRFPDKYWMWNLPVRKFLEAQNIDVRADLPSGKKSNLGEEYMAAGKYIKELRNALEQQSKEPVNFLLTDLFLYWATGQDKTQNQTANQWSEKIAAWVKELDPIQLQTRLQGETKARQLLESKLGEFTEDDLRTFAQNLSADWYRNAVRYDRFKPAFSDPQVNMLIRSLSSFNPWVKQIWQATDEQLDSLLDQFWNTTAVHGGGITLPTALLYLKDPEKYNIWLDITTQGLQIAANFQPGRKKTAAGYRLYNQVMNDFRKRHNLKPQILDIILWQAVVTQPSGTSSGSNTLFTGFTTDTFQFLQELRNNNNDEWMHSNKDANMNRFQVVLREPLRALFSSVAPSVQQIYPGLETEDKILATIRKRFPDEKEGPYHPYLWGAFYRKGRTKQTDCQLFVNVHPNHVNVGLSIAGSQGLDVLKRFRENLQKFPEVFLELVCQLPTEFHISVAPKHGLSDKPIIQVSKVEDLKPLLEADLIDIEQRFDKTDPILQSAGFVAKVASAFSSCHFLYLFAIGDTDTVGRLIEPIDPPDELFTLEDLIRITNTSLFEEFWNKVSRLLEDKGQIIFYGPPGTGKTWVAKHFARYWVDQAKEVGGDFRVVQFHPSYSYEEFIEGIRPETVDSPGGLKQITYPVKQGIFRRLCDEASQYPNRRYVLIIDEINRGELPRIFGELLYLLEYRTASVELQYSASQGQFSIPRNVFLIGTMNTSDRSIALVDHALRRRFYFVPMRPDPELLRSYLQDHKPEMVWVADLLATLNRKLQDEAKIEWEMHIGHSHFMKDNLDEEQLKLVWEYSILPTLEEYFYRKDEEYLKGFSFDVIKAQISK